MSDSTVTAPVTPPPPGTPGTGKLHGLLVEFDDVAALKEAARRVRAAGYRCWDAHSPFPVHGMDELMGIRHTRLPWIVFVFGVLGCLGGVLLQWYTNASDPRDFTWLPTFLQGYDFRVSGQPRWSFPANVPVIFETTVLLAALATVVAMLAMNGLPRWHHALLHHPRFARVTSDRFFLCVESRDPLFHEERTDALLAALGGSAVEPVYQPPRAGRPAWAPLAALVVACLALLPPLWVYKMHVSLKDQPRLHPIQDMDNQERFKAQQANPAFADGRAMRPVVAGTIAREDEWALGAAPHYHEGRLGDQWGTTFPPQIEISEALLRRGQRQFNVYCAVCHGLDGSGNGIVAQRVRDKTQIATGWVPPTSLHDPLVRDRPLGHIFNTITHGIRTMPPYGDQLSVADRWAIVAYLRALARSQNTSVEDVPPEQRKELR